MKKILINIKNNSLYFSYKNSINKEQQDLLNTNVIFDNELVFSDEYINENEKIVSAFIKELAIENNIHKVEVSKYELSLLILKLIKKNDYINTFSIKENCNLTYTVCEEIAKSKYIKTLNCFSAPLFMIEMLDEHNITIESRNETFFISNFMEENNLQLFSKIYYKTSIRLSPPLSYDDIEDFKAFLKINRYLKTIHMNNFDDNTLRLILKITKEFRLKNLKVIIHDDSNNIDNIEYLKRLNKRYKNKLVFKISYSDDYLKNNIFKQVILNTLKICGLLITVIVIGIISYVSISNYKSMKDLAVIQEDINKVIEQAKEEQKNIDNNGSGNTTEDENTDKSIINNDIAALLSINSDVYGWLKVNNTNIDYPVVKGDDNDYYLKHNLYKEKDKNGWVFMDYRNSITSDLSKHTIIYGHNMYYSGVMFGTLHKAYNKSWYSKEANQIITFNSIYKNMKFKIFSIYKIPKTSDYLTTDFSSDKDFLDFTKMLKERSIYNFKVDIKSNDKILTLSTCTGENDRLVIHAKLMEE